MYDNVWPSWFDLYRWTMSLRLETWSFLDGCSLSSMSKELDDDWLGDRIVENVDILFSIHIDTKCVRYFPTKATWPVAASTCHDLQAELISFHDPSILSLIYQVTGNAPGRKKRVPTIFDTIAGWTSARATQLNGCK